MLARSIIRPVCRVIGCGKLGHNTGTKDSNGHYYYRQICESHHNEKYGMKSGKYTIYKKTYCERCFISDNKMSSSILQVDHKDGNKNNNSPANLQTLCYTCHKDKTSICKDWINKEPIAVLPGYDD